MAGRVALLCLPFASARRPSLQIGLLAGLARGVGWQADPQHLNLEFAKLVGPERYEALCQHRGTLLSEWLFAGAAFGDGEDDAAVELSLAGYDFGLLTGELGLSPDDVRGWLRRVRRVLVPLYLETLLHSRDWGQYDVVGFTSTFQQNVASFAFARRLKEEFPGVVTLFGGANFDGQMGLEYLRVLDFVDYAAVGEGDQSFPAFLTALSRGTPDRVPGIARRTPEGEVRVEGECAPFDDLDSLPTPDYDDYFDRAERLGLPAATGRAHVDLPVETARGCWWGQKHHCIFCGLNSETMRFRRKSAQRAVAEINELSTRYKSLGIEAVDNILDLSYLSTVLPEVAERGHDFDIFYETKSNLAPEDLAVLARAGVRRIQPGIESLSTPLLQVMRKGTTGIRNVAFLKWCRRFGIRPSWNLLWGFPGEQPEHYEQQLATVAMIPHLQPPDGEGRLWLERFSPMFVTPQEFGVRDVRPLASYQSVYPSTLDVERAAYFFEYEMDGALPEAAFEPLREALAGWRDAWAGGERPPQLVSRKGPGFVEVSDRRPGWETGSYLLEGLLAEVHVACERRPVALDKVATGCDRSVEEVTEVAAALARRGLLLVEGRYALSLAVAA